MFLSWADADILVQSIACVVRVLVCSRTFYMFFGVFFFPNRICMLLKHKGWLQSSLTGISISRVICYMIQIVPSWVSLEDWNLLAFRPLLGHISLWRSQKFNLLFTVKNSNIGSWAELCTKLCIVMGHSLELVVVSIRISKPYLKRWE